MPPKSIVIAALFCLGSCTLLSSCNSAGGFVAHMGPPAMPVKLAVVKRASVDETSSFMGALDSSRSASLQPRVSGTISKILVSEGQNVAEGDPLVEIDPEKQRATVSSAAATVESASSDKTSAEETLHSLEAQRTAKEANVKFMQKELRRYAWLSQQGAVARETYDNYAVQLQVAKSDLSSIEKQIASQKATIDKITRTIKQNAAATREQQVQLRYYTIRAPFAGVVGDLPFHIGEYVDSNAKVTTVTQNKPLEVSISVPAERAHALHMGMPVLLIDGSGRQLGESRVFFISPVADDSQSVLVKALFDNSAGQLRSNQTVTAKLVWRRSDSLTVPTYAVAHISGQDFVFVASGDAPNMVSKQKAVQLGEIVGNDYVVKSGLLPGERLIVSGVQNLIDNMPIKAKE